MSRPRKILSHARPAARGRARPARPERPTRQRGRPGQAYYRRRQQPYFTGRSGEVGVETDYEIIEIPGEETGSFRPDSLLLENRFENPDDWQPRTKRAVSRLIGIVCLHVD